MNRDKLKMEITSKPTALDAIDREIIKLQMEILSLSRDGSAMASAADKKSTESKLKRMKKEIDTLKSEQKTAGSLAGRARQVGQGKL